MSTPCEPRPCALHVLVPCGEVVRPDPVRLVDAPGERVAEVTGATPSSHDRVARR